MSHSKVSVTTFQPSYTTEFPWVKEDGNNKSSAVCKLCKSTINISSMGKTALKSHAKSAKHISFENNQRKCISLGVFFKGNPCAGSTNVAGTSASQEIPPIPGPSHDAGSPSAVEKPKGALKNYLLSESVTKSEILWCLEIVMNHISFRAAARCAENFKHIFPDSDIAAKLSLQRTKVGYTTVFGLAPYFKKELGKQLSGCDKIVICFDECLNKIAQKQQMDLHIRFWDMNKKEVGTRFMTSVFLGHSRAVDLLEAIKQSFDSDVLKRKVIQISMDGPNVNFRMVSDLQKELSDSEDSPILLELGSCGLHTVHNAFKNGMKATGWDMVTFFRSLYNLFKDSPARRADYIRISGSNKFPLKFCAVRWIESGRVAERALLILSSVEKYVEGVVKEKKEPTCNSYIVVKQKLTDKLLLAKIAFFSTICSSLEPFLKEFQKDEPMAPFVYSEMQSLAFGLFEKVVKKDVLEAKKTQLHKIDLSNTDVLKNIKHIDLGFATVDAMKSCSITTDLEKMNFRRSARDGLVVVLKKIMEKSPLKFKLSKSISCLDPSLIKSDMKLAEMRLSKCLEELVEKKWLSGIKADSVKRQYLKFFASSEVIDKCKMFKRNQTRLDSFFNDLLNEDDDFKELFDFVKLILTLSHGNASVERGFSINKECLVENLHEESLVALRQIHDGVTSVGGLGKLVINKDLIHSARNAHARYLENLKEKKDELSEQSRIERAKKQAALEQKKLEAEKANILSEARKRAAEIDEKLSEIKKSK